MKQFYYNLFTTLIIITTMSCNTTKTTATEEVYLPAILDNIKLGMPMEQVLQLRSKAYVVNSIQETPRHVYTEDFETEAYQSVYYFFSKNGDKPLVELNVYHSSDEAAEKTVTTLFGEKQSKQNQWHKTLKDGTEIHATWRKRKVFIFIDTEEGTNNKTEKTAEE